MIRYLTLGSILDLYARVMARSGGLAGIRDLGALESALAQPKMTFAGEDLYPALADKASALGFSLIGNHPFVDGNKRIGHAAMEVSLILNGWEIEASVDVQERVILGVAAGELSREQLANWLEEHLHRVNGRSPGS